MALRRSLIVSLSVHALALSGVAWMAFGAQAGAREPAGGTQLAFLEPQASPELDPSPEPELLDELDPPPPDAHAPRPADVPFEEEPPVTEGHVPLHEPFDDGRLLARLGGAPDFERQPRPQEPRPDAAIAASAPAPEAAAPQPAASSEALVLEAPAPVYPRVSLRLGEQGTVRLAIAIGADGAVRSASVLISSGHPRLDQAAREAVLSWRFAPAVRTGSPVAATVEHLVTFRLTEGT